MGMVIRQAARRWYAAECAADPKLPQNLTDGDLYALAVPRVRQLFAGEVRWSETSPGDKAIWRGRPRDVEHTPQWLSSCWENVYDTIDLSPNTVNVHTRMFGIENVGNYVRTNMMLAGQICGALTFDVHQMYADLSRDLDIRDRVNAELVIGGRRTGQVTPLRDLAMGLPVGRTILARQDFYVTLDAFRVVAPLEVVLHLEGTVMRTEY